MYTKSYILYLVLKDWIGNLKDLINITCYVFLLNTVYLKLKFYIYYILGIKKMLLDKAMKEGYVTVKWTKFSVSGAPGTGKSSFLNLLYNEDPPDCHNSTPIIAVKDTTVGDDSVWRKTDLDSLKRVIALGIIDHSIQPIKPEVVEKPDSLEYKQINQPLEESVDHPTDQQKELSGSNGSESLTTAGHEQTVDQNSLSKSTVIQEIMDILTFVNTSEELYRTHWIYGVDTGGQAAFIDIAPVLLRCHSVNIVTHKLTERLDDKAKFFYSVEGKLISEPVEKQITNLQFLESFFRSVLSVNLSVLPNNSNNHVQEPVYIILGTFLDKMVKSYESLQKKNKILSTALQEYRPMIIMHSRSKNEIIFPVNTVGRGIDEKKMATRIRKKICQYYIEAKIPIRWFLFQLELQNSSKSNIVSLSNCLEIGRTLQMSDSDVQAALNYYHDLTIFLYFPEILPNVVFLHPQPLFNKLSDLISISFDDTMKHLGDDVSLTTDTDEELKDGGTFKEDLLTSPTSHLSQGFYPEFTPQHFLKLMTSLFIIASLPERGKYFLPTVLPTTSCFTKYKSIPHRFKQCTDPLIVSWDMKPLPQGVFPALIVNLLNRNHSPKFELVRPSKSAPRYRNAITLHTDYGVILLVDGIYWMAIYSIDHFKGCFALREAVHAGIHKVICNFRNMADLKYFEYFYCNIWFCKCSEHFCRVNDDKKTVTCCDSNKTMSLHESRQLPWFTKEGEF